MIIVSDNSALSCLAEPGELDLLRQMYGTVTITDVFRRLARTKFRLGASVVEELRQRYRYGSGPSTI